MYYLAALQLDGLATLQPFTLGPQYPACLPLILLQRYEHMLALGGMTRKDD